MAESEVDLSLRVGDIVLRNPIILSPGPLGRSPQSMKLFADAGCGAVASKTLSLEPWKGNPNPKRVQVPCGWMINAEGGPNIGVEAFEKAMEKVRREITESRVIISVVGKTIDDFVDLTCRAEQMGADVVDLDITCPNVSEAGTVSSWQKDLKGLRTLIETVKGAVSVPLWIKFISSYGTLLEIASVLEQAGADAVVPLISISAMAIDVDTGRPSLGFRHGVGIATGPPLKYAALKAVADVCRTVKIPVIATGGCSRGLDLIEYVMAGARGVQMHTALMQNGRRHVQTMIAEASQFLGRKGWSRLEDLVGLTLRFLPQEPLSVWYR